LSHKPHFPIAVLDSKVPLLFAERPGNLSKRGTSSSWFAKGPDTGRYTRPPTVSRNGQKSVGRNSSHFLAIKIDRARFPRHALTAMIARRIGTATFERGFAVYADVSTYSAQFPILIEITDKTKCPDCFLELSYHIHYASQRIERHIDRLFC
jgi:hypothetical protein